MTATRWKKRIKDACEEAGTYRPFFDSAIDTLSDILERRDNARKQWEDEGCELMVAKYTNKGVGREQNPLVKLINELNRDAWAFWKDLGLTPGGLKKLDEKALKEQKKTSLSDLLGGL